MFSGIITDLGEVRSIGKGGDSRIAIATAYDTDTIALGASIACSGVCLTVVETGADWFGVDVSAETLRRTTLGEWRPGRAVNLERSLKLGDELGGHIVLGHVDGIAEICDRTAEGDSQRFTLVAPDEFASLIAEKASVALDGVSLTVNRVDGSEFDVNLIPHTLRCTGFGSLRPGDHVNLEVDVLARYVARLNRGERT